MTKKKNVKRNSWDALVEKLGGIKAAKAHMSKISSGYHKKLGHTIRKK